MHDKRASILNKKLNGVRILKQYILMYILVAPLFFFLFGLDERKVIKDAWLTSLFLIRMLCMFY